MAGGWVRKQPGLAAGDGARGEWWSNTGYGHTGKARTYGLRTGSARTATATVRAVTRMSAMSARRRCYPLAMASLVLGVAGRRVCGCG